MFGIPTNPSRALVAIPSQSQHFPPLFPSFSFFVCDLGFSAVALARIWVSCVCPERWHPLKVSECHGARARPYFFKKTLAAPDRYIYPIPSPLPPPLLAALSFFLHPLPLLLLLSFSSSSTTFSSYFLPSFSPSLRRDPGTLFTLFLWLLYMFCMVSCKS